MGRNNIYFYRHLPAIRDFSETVALEHYTPIPDNWLVIASDVRGSTEAILAGNYKSVNMAGACVIAAVCNEFPEIELPFVFGGDGALIAIPGAGRERILGILRYCSDAVKSAYGLELTAGCRAMAELRCENKEVKVGKYMISENVNQAIFWGNGVDYVEEIIKQPGNGLSGYKKVKADFSGLECRWNEIPAGKDEILSIIIKSTILDEEARSRFYKRSLKVIEQIYGSEDQYRPISEDRLSLSVNPFKLHPEANIRVYPKTLLRRAFYYVKLFYQQLAGRFLMKNEIATKNTKWGEYKRDFIRNADFRKFSDGLKLVVSGTEGQRVRLKSFLETEYKNGKVVFGLHSSPAAISTCFVTDYQGKHLHFIDGSGGGYTAASMELKRQLNEFNSMKTTPKFAEVKSNEKPE